jgi:hypothetical protein
MKAPSTLAICLAALLLSACSSTPSSQRSGWLPQVNPMGTPDMVSSRQPTDYYNLVPATDD